MCLNSRKVDLGVCHYRCPRGVSPASGSVLFTNSSEASVFRPSLLFTDSRLLSMFGQAVQLLRKPLLVSCEERVQPPLLLLLGSSAITAFSGTLSRELQLLRCECSPTSDRPVFWHVGGPCGMRSESSVLKN